MLSEQLFLTLPPLLPEQEELQPPVPTVLGSIDYKTWRRRLERIDEILRQARVEEAFIRLALKRRLGELEERARQNGQSEFGMKEGDQLQFQRICAVALRTTIARTVTGESYRDFATRLADSTLLQWFCRLNRLGPVPIPGKSQLQRYQELVNEPELRQVVNHLQESVAEPDSPLELAEELDLETRFLDSTCVRLNIHYPTDWVLLRDATRTLMKATILIRKRGLKVRMKEPTVFLKRMNQLSMEMTKQGRRSGSRKARKKTLRAMKREVKTVAAHARRHRESAGETVGGDGPGPGRGAADHRPHRHHSGAVAVCGETGARADHRAAAGAERREDPESVRRARGGLCAGQGGRGSGVWLAVVARGS